MSILKIFISVDVVLMLIAAKLIFKDFKTFRKSLYWFIYPNVLTVWTKKTWDKDINNSIKMEMLLLVAFILFGLNILVYKVLL